MTAVTKTRIPVCDKDMQTLQIAGFLDHSTVNGEGFRSVVFLSGCRHGCLGCHNKEMQDFHYGETVTIDEIIARITKNITLIDGITLSGGEPFEQSKNLLPLVKQLKQLGLSIWVYTGYLYEELLQNPDFAQLLFWIDVLVDGKYIEAYASSHLRYRGSSNQRFLKLVDGQLQTQLTY